MRKNACERKKHHHLLSYSPRPRSCRPPSSGRPGGWAPPAGRQRPGSGPRRGGWPWCGRLCGEGREGCTSGENASWPLFSPSLARSGPGGPSATASFFPIAPRHAGPSAMTRRAVSPTAGGEGRNCTPRPSTHMRRQLLVKSAARAASKELPAAAAAHTIATHTTRHEPGGRRGRREGARVAWGKRHVHEPTCAAQRASPRAQAALHCPRLPPRPTLNSTRMDTGGSAAENARAGQPKKEVLV